MKPAQKGILLISTFLVKILLCFIIPVFGDESYYWFWGQHPQLSYFDHPGMVGWLTYLGSIFNFLPIQVVVRGPFVIMSTVSLFLFIQSLEYIHGSKQNKNTYFAAILFYLLNPLLGFGSLLATPDVPLVFFWSLSYYFLLRILNTQKTRDYALLGLSLGLGLCSKYHIVLFPLSIIVSLLLSKKIQLINPKKIIFTFVFGLLASMPVLIWNMQNDWASFAFQLNHGLNGASFNILWLITYVLGQILLFNPFLFFILIRKFKTDFKLKMPIVQWCFFLLSSLRASVEANWPITAHIDGLSQLKFDKTKVFKIALSYWICIWIVFIVFYFTPFGKQKISQIPNSDIAQQVWSEVSDYAPLYGPTYQMSSLLHLVSGTEILKLKELSRVDFYDSDQFKKPTINIFYALKYTISDWPMWLSSAKIEKIKDLSADNLSLYKIEMTN